MEWMAKRLLKAAIKHSVGRYLVNEPDLKQLDVQLSSGRLELKDAVLKTEALNPDLVRAGHAAHGHSGAATRIGTAVHMSSHAVLCAVMPAGAAGLAGPRWLHRPRGCMHPPAGPEQQRDESGAG